MARMSERTAKKLRAPETDAATEPAAARMSPRAARAFREVGMVGAWAMALFALLALLTYSPLDSWWLSDGEDDGE